MNKFSVGTHELFCHISTRGRKAAVAAGLRTVHVVERKKTANTQAFFMVRAGVLV
jgi:hypothetical protein